LILKKIQPLERLNERPRQNFKQVLFGLLLIVFPLILSGCGLISSKPTQTPDVQSSVEQAEVQVSERVEVSADVAEINLTQTSVNSNSANISLRFLSIAQESKDKLSNEESQHGYYWLDGLVKDIEYRNGVVHVVEIESAYDGEHYFVSGNTSLLEKLVKGRFTYLDGFYDTFSGFTALKYSSGNELLESLIDNSAANVDIDGNEFAFRVGSVEELNKRRQVILLSGEKEIKLNNDVSFYDAYSKNSLTKNAFWRALSQGDKVYSFNNQVWLVDQQTENKAVIGTVKQVNNAQNEIVLTTDLWLMQADEAVKQNAEVLLKLGRKTQILSTDGQVVGLSVSSLVPGQKVVVEGTQKNRLLNVERLYVKEKKNLPVYVYGTVNKLEEGSKSVDLTVEWMFGSEPSTTVEVAVNSFTELFEIDDKETMLDSLEFWKLVSFNDDIEVEGYMVGSTLQANRLFLGNKEIELQTLSGTVDSTNNLDDGEIALRLYSYASQISLPEANSQDMVALSLASDVTIQDIHGAESIVVEEFCSRLEPTDQLTVTGYFEDDSFIATSVEFEDKDTTPFIFGEVEAFNVSKKQIMLKGKNQVVVLTNTTSIKDSKLARLSVRNFWSELSAGDSVDIKGQAKEGVFFATEVFLSSEAQDLEEELEKKDSFNLFEWLMN